MIDSSPFSRNPWIHGRTVESLVDGLNVSVMREARNGWVHVTLNMNRAGFEVVSGSIVLSAETWETLVAELPSRGDGAVESIRGRGLDFDSTLSLARQPESNRVAIGLRPTPLARASCNVQTVLEPETWAALVDEIR